MNRKLKAKLQSHIVQMYMQENVMVTDLKKIEGNIKEMVEQLYSNSSDSKNEKVVA